MGRKKFHGDPARFDVLAEYVHGCFGTGIQYIADVAGGQGMLSRVLRKQYNYDSEVIDPRGWTMKGVPNREAEYVSAMADYYDLVIGLHADEATRPVAESALIRPALILPCCNFWSDEKLGRNELVEAIEAFYRKHQVSYERVTFGFKGPKNIGIVSCPTNESAERFKANNFETVNNE
ncbi:hypothetical protein PDESU_06041 [Pontiella desulfatans]|uniref:Uncharacterized protein n=1 Tax=Pontiella desulfatans TaxID=2750659 RepID=A0A6C2UBM3_PONDE|nr:hypothetical protein [Pontiella desulfatans]VGO17445.1 hypothetical protein PDESU_06041 [Pontiella desulfatans]